MRLRTLAILAALALPLPVLAGPVRDFETQYRDAYASYRRALFATNAGDAATAFEARGALDDKWAALIPRWEASPPPHYEDDASFATTLEQVAWLINKSSGQIAEGDLLGAHETLEGIRNHLGALHKRNDIESFSDRMNAYHDKMETLLRMDLSKLDADTIAALRAQFAVLEYLSIDVVTFPPSEGEGNPAFRQLSAAFAASIANLAAALQTGEAKAIRAAVKGLKKPYARLFLKFG